MTTEQAKQWADRLNPDQIAGLLVEHHQLKNGLCERILGIPTGAEDWMKRSFRKADHLRNCESQLRIMLAGITKLAEEATYHTLIRECSNCQGTKTINSESCCICGGTGRRSY